MDMRWGRVFALRDGLVAGADTENKANYHFDGCMGTNFERSCFLVVFS
jgi:hypothetical protein